MLRKVLECLIGDLSDYTDRELKENSIMAILMAIMFLLCLFYVYVFG